MSKKRNINQFIDIVNKIHNNYYDYSLVDYKNNNTKIKIICPKHGVFEQIPSHHIRGSKCPKCSVTRRSNTKENFIKKSKDIHNNKYNYSLVDYKNSNTKVEIICPIHGIFQQKPYSHLSGSGCPSCHIDKMRNNNDNFIKRSSIIHNNQYDYSIVDYIDNKTKIKIICPIHGIFEQTPHAHLNGQKCPKCQDTKKTNLDFKQISKNKHNNYYDYSLVNYINNKTKVNIICPKHGIFKQRPDDHLNGHGCIKCSGKLRNNLKDIISKSNEIHNNLYNYDKSIYINNKTKMIVTCPKHGDFKVTPNNHINKKSGCPKCKESIGERTIRLFLEDNNIKYIIQKRFKNCKYKLSLPFDFYLMDYNICIEYDGIQHFKSLKFFGGYKRLNEQKIKDSIKNNYCLNNNIKLYRISYKDDINIKLNEIKKGLNI
ncbi:MAG: DUF723 domain-containing protein [Saccharofermentanales bacterium]